MKLYIGGMAQGKLEYVLQQYGRENCLVINGSDMTGDEAFSGFVSGGSKITYLVMNQFHVWVRELLLKELPAEEIVEDFLHQYPEIILICDEVGNGIVPLMKEDREFRERLGRILIRIAGQSEEVWRIICGLAQRLK